MATPGTIKNDQPAEGARENVNYPIPTDEARIPSAHEPRARAAVDDTTPEERDRDSQAPRDPGDTTRRGNL